MPKEAVYGRMAPPVTGECNPDEQPIVEVRWHRESGMVQVVTRLQGAEMPSLDEQENIPARYGMYVEIDRTEINRLIRHLRRARDQAFGRDE